jgi:S1-C subfamily serine protease
MYRTSCTLALAVALLAAAGRATGDEKSRLTEALGFEDLVVDAIKKAEPSIACVLVSYSEDRANQKLDDPTLVPESFGSGVVIDEKGLILTNFHVVRDATRIYVRVSGRRGGYAEIHAGDARSDLAVLRLTDPSLPQLKPLKFGDTASIRKGQFVVAMANPFDAGFRDGSPSASLGIISNVRRRPPPKPADRSKSLEETNFKTLHEFGTLLQTTVPLNVGSSGGALLNIKGELIGLTTSLAGIYGGETPGGFAVPMDDGMRRIIEVLRRGEEVEYGFLGVRFPTDQGPPQHGEAVQIVDVIQNSPAFTADLRAGRDYILSVNGVKVQEPEDLFLALGTLLAGSTIQLDVAPSPKGPSHRVTVKLAKYYVPGKIIASKRPEPVRGLRVDYTSILCQRPGGMQIYGRAIPHGVMIREVVSGSAADAARLQETKVITEVNGQDVGTPDEFYREMRTAVGPVELTLMSPDGRRDKVKLALQ